MAQLLADGRFIREALAPISDALDAALLAASLKTGTNTDTFASVSRVSQLQTALQLPGQTTSLVATLRHERDNLSEAAAKESFALASKVLDAVQVAVQSST